MNNRVFCRYFIMCLFTAFFSIAMSSLDFSFGIFCLIVPFIFFCFFYNRWMGAVALLSSLIPLVIVNKWYVLTGIIILLSVVFVKNILRFNNKKMELILGIYSFFVILFCTFLQVLFSKSNYYFLPFIVGLIGYWVMRYYCKLYFSFRGLENTKFDSSISSFLFIILGLAFWGLNIEVWAVNLSYILIVSLCFIAVKIGFDVGAVYSLTMSGLLFLFKENNLQILFLLYSFLVLFFLKNVSRVTIVFTYLSGIFLLCYYLGESYVNVVDYFVVGLFILTFPGNVIRDICCICYGSESYINKLAQDSRKFNLEIASKIVKMEEVFSLVSEKLDVKERIKKNDKKLLVEEVNLFGDLLKSFSLEIKENHSFNCNYRVEKEFYKYGVDLLSFSIKENVFKEKNIVADVRCEKKELRSFVVPLINKITGNVFELVSVFYNDVFGYYRLSLQQKKRISFKFGVSQRSLDKKVCGDSYLVYENDQHYIFAISDGMGNGKDARESSKLALDLFKKFMDIGFGLEQTMKSLNSILRGKYDRECYSTLDVFVYDKFNGKFYFCKNGACDSYVLNENRIVLKGDKLPLGIIDKIDVDIKEIEVNRGDYVVMMSDGVDEGCLLEESKFSGKSVQKISELIIDNDNSIKDDKTVLVIKVC